jgi:Flp pilus assembly protein TadD
MHLQSAHGWLELGNTNESKKELELIAAPLRTHPDVLGLHWAIHENLGNWDQCVSIGRALVESVPEETSGWIHRSFALHEMKRTQEAYDELKPALDMFEKEQIVWYNMACYACCLGEKMEARTLLNRAIEIGGDAVRVQALNDSDLRGVWGSDGIAPAQIQEE